MFSGGRRAQGDALFPGTWAQRAFTNKNKAWNFGNDVKFSPFLPKRLESLNKGSEPMKKQIAIVIALGAAMIVGTAPASFAQSNGNAAGNGAATGASTDPTVSGAMKGDVPGSANVTTSGTARQNGSGSSTMDGGAAGAAGSSQSGLSR
jgi:hypothetical protein